MQTRRSKRGADAHDEEPALGFSFMTHQEEDAGAGGEGATAHAVLLKVEDPKNGSPPPGVVWNNEIIRQGMTPFVEGLPPVTECYVLNRGEVLLFHGRRTKDEGWTECEARELALRLTAGEWPWIGLVLEARGRALVLESARERINQCIKEKRKEKAKSMGARRDAPGGRQRRAGPAGRRSPPPSGPESDEDGSFHSLSDQESETSELGDIEDVPVCCTPYQCRFTAGGTGLGPCNQCREDAAQGRRPQPPPPQAANRHGRRRLVQAERAEQRREERAHHYDHEHNRVRVELATFRGDPADDPTAVTYASWRFDVEVHRTNGVPERELLPKVIVSLKGPPGDLIRTHAVNITLDSILETLDSYYGNVLTCDRLVQELYQISQTSGESATQYGLRVHKIIALIRKLYPEEMTADAAVRRKLDRFYEGLKEPNRSALAFMRERPGITYQELLSAARGLEEKQAREKGNQPEAHQTRRESKPPAVFESRRPRGIHTTSKNARSDIIELARQFVEPEPPAEYSEEEGEAPEDLEFEAAVRVLQAAKFTPRDPNARFKKGGPFMKTPEERANSRNCYNCNGEGHLARECPSPRRPRAGSKNERGEGNMTDSPLAQTGSRSAPSPLQDE